MRAYWLVIVVWVLVGILFIGFLIPTPVYITVYKEATEYTQQHCASHNNINPVLSKVGNAILDAAFWTAVATIAIAWEAAKDQITVAKEAADAAKLSAQAAIGVELPRLLVNKIEFQNREIADLPGARTVIVTVTNYRRTPAFVFRETAEMRIIPILPPGPDYRNQVDLEPEHVIESGATYNITARLHDFTSILAYQRLLDRKEKMWIYGRIGYRDFLDERHSKGFCAKLYFPIGLADGMPPRFIQGNCPDQYTQSS